MWWIPSFAVWSFVIAGIACACGPIIIHLLNRRRYRVVQWAAMDFLKEAMQRNRRILHLRDMILLAMRTLAVLLFGLALAQPFFTRGCNQAVDDRQPLHAIVVIDNSLSMGYEGLDGTLLDKAKDRARRLIDQLPTGSKITVLPACGSREGTSLDPYDTKDGALDAIGKLELVDRSTSLAQVANVVQRAVEHAPDLSKRVVVFSDQQATNWRDANADVLKKLQDWQLVAVAPAGSAADWENSWVADIEVADGLADIETPTTIIVKLQHQGGVARQDLQVKLSFGDTVIGERAVSLEPGASSKEVEFEYVFNTLTDVPEPDHPIFVALKAEIQGNDSLAADNVRFLALPVVAGLPVVFVDQYGTAEDPARFHLGETRHLRKLLAPKTSRTEAPRQLVKIRHLTQGELDQEVLQDARLVVLAGLREPQSEETVLLLRDYVRQGGRLVIAAGAEFDPVRWQELAWRDGDGILPLPLKEAIGEVPEVAGANLKPFSISVASLSGDGLFQLPSTGQDELRDLYEEPFFFKAVATDASQEARDVFQRAARDRLDEELKLRAEIVRRRETLVAKTSGEITGAEQEQQRADEARLAELQPHWLTWAADQGSDSADVAISTDKTLDKEAAEAARNQQIEALVQRQLPRILARFDDRQQTPFLIARRQGQGEVLFVSTGLLSSWNTLPKTNAILMFDRLLRTMTRSTLPQRNYQPLEQLTLPVPAHQHDLAVSLTRPHQLDPEPLDIGFIGNDRQGVTLHGLYQRGVYRVAGVRQDPGADASTTAVAKIDDKLAEKPIWEVPVVVNGDASESELVPLTRAEFEEKAAGSTIRWVEASEDISLAGAAIRGQSSWWYLALAVLVLLLAEMAVLAWPAFRPQTVV